MELFMFLFIVFSLFAEVFGAKKPPAPKFTLEGTSPSSITIKLTPPSVGGISGYRVQYAATGGSKKLITIGAVTEEVIDGLTPGTVYKFRIATNAASNGKFSPWANQATLDEAVVVEPEAPSIPEPPQNLVADTTATTASITWDPPVDNGAEITGYTMSYGTLDNPTANSLTLEPSSTQTNLEGLTSSAQYQVSLIAYNADGESAPITAEFQTAEGKLPPPPVENVQSNPTESTIEVTWTLPETTSANEIESIAVSFGEDGTPVADLPVSSLEKGAVSYIAEQLSPGTSYTVALVTQNQQGESDPVVITAETIAAAAPAPTQPAEVPIPDMPQNLRANDVSTNSARLTWDPPVDNGAEIVGYVVSYGPMSDPTANTMTLDPNPTQYDLTELETDIEYSVYVTAYNSKGQSTPAEVEFMTVSGRETPPPVENVQSYPTEQSVYFTWTLPTTTAGNAIETIRLGFGPYGTSVDYLPMTNLEKDTVSYTAERLAPGTRYTVALITQNSEGDSNPVTLTVETDPPRPVATRPPAPDKGYIGRVPPAPVELTATVLSPTSIRVTFVDPTLGGRTNFHDERFYTLRYKREEDANYQYLNIRETPYTIDYLHPESTYEVDVKLVIDRDTESPFTQTEVVFTGENIVRDVSAVQLLVTAPGRVKIVLNWIPPLNQPQSITGYAVEYAAGYYVTSRSSFERIIVNGPIPKAIIEDLAGDSTYHVRVAPRFGSGIGRFSDPPDAFNTPPIPVAGQPLFCDDQETEEQISQRVAWMRGRSGLIGVPLPYCDDYYGMHECHGSVCFCIPGKAPRRPGSCSRGVARSYGDDPRAYATTAPCDAEYEAALEAIDEASKNGKPLLEVRLPYCTEEGYYQSKQCLGSMCYCSTRNGKHTGKQAPLWEAANLRCCKYYVGLYDN